MREDAHSLCKGEVVSSILTGSTRYSRDKRISISQRRLATFDTKRSMKATFGSCVISAV
jgi:hypothetical protein